MNWKQAVKHMEQGGSVRRKSWLPGDFLFIRDGKLFCDGGFEYLAYLKSVSGRWYKSKLRPAKPCPPLPSKDGVQ